MTEKTYGVYFYSTAVGEQARPLAATLAAAVRQHGPHLPELAMEGTTYQVRDLVHVGRTWSGVFAQLRDDAPHVVTVAGAEEPLDLAEGDRLVEKCHFLYFTTSNVMVWQNVRGLGGMSTAQRYFSEALETVVQMPQLMNEGELDHVLAGQVYELQFSFARPHRPDNGAPEWSSRAFDMMESVHAAKAKFMLRAPRNGSLTDAAKQMIRSLVRDQTADKVRVKLTDESNLIDLFMSPLKDRITVQLLGRYPAPGSVYEALNEAYDRQRHNLPPPPAPV